MKKLIVSAVVLLAAGSSAVKASTLSARNYAAAIYIQADTVKKTPVKLDALPDPVKAVLATDVFKTWVPAEAYSVTSGTTQYFEVDVKKGTDVKALKFDKGGKILQ